MLRRKESSHPAGAATVVQARRLQLRPLTIDDFDEWREVRRRCHD